MKTKSTKSSARRSEPIERSPDESLDVFGDVAAVVTPAKVARSSTKGAGEELAPTRSPAELASAIVAFLRSELATDADPRRARAMAAYMKTDMPFYGVPQPEREPIFREMVRRFPIPDAASYEAAVLAVWNQPHREEKYAALTLAISWRPFITLDRLDLYERLIREGAWWDLVDEMARHLVSPIQRRERALVRPIMDRWIQDPDMWVRRAAILSQLGHKGHTDADQLFDYCLACAHEKEFFIRKAIGWALRNYSYVAPEAVYAFLNANQDRLSPLSQREGAKQLARSGWEL